MSETPVMDLDTQRLYEHLLDLKEIEPSEEDRKKIPSAKAYMPPLPVTLQKLHARFALYFRRQYNRDIERAHLPMIAAMAMELDSMLARFIEKGGKDSKKAA